MKKCALTDGNKNRLVPQFAKIFLNSNQDSAESAGNTLGEFLFANFDENDNQANIVLNITNQEQIIADTLKQWVQLMQTVLGNSPENERLQIKLKDVLTNIELIANTAINFAKQKYQGDGEAPMEMPNDEYFNVGKQVEFSTLNDLYGTAQQARTEMQKMLRKRLIATLFVDFKNGRIIKNQEQVNVGITEWQQELVDNITKYAKARGIDANIKLFENGVYQSNSFTKLYTLAKDLFKDFNSTKLNNMFGSRMLPLEGMGLLAYNSWVILNNFDMLVKNLLGKTITINESLKSFQDASKNKYSLNNGSNLVKSWRSTEDISAIDELGSVTKLLLDSTPVYNFDDTLGLDQKPQRLFGRELTTADVAYAFAKVREHPTFKIQAQAIRYNPMLYIPDLIKAALASSTKFDEDTQNIKNILFSVYKRFFQLHKTNNDEEYSLTEIMNGEQQTSYYIITNNLLSYITGMIDKTVPNNHVEYAVDSDTGRIVPRFSSTSSLENYKYTVQRNIDNLNNTLDAESKQELLDTFQLKHTGQGGHIKTKWNVEYTFGGRKYRIEFDNTHKHLVLENLKVEYEQGGKKDFIDYKSYPDQKEIENAIVYLLDKTLFMNLSNKPELVDVIIDSFQKIPNLPNGEKDRVQALARVALLSSRVLLKHKFDSESKGTYNNAINYEYGTKRKEVWFDKRAGKVKATLMDNQTNELLKLLAKSQMIINGEVVKSTVRNLEGNSVAAEGLTNYINNIRTTWLDAEFQENSAVGECIFALNPDLLSTITLKGAAQTSDKLKVKSNKDFNVAEAGFSAVMKDFLLGYMLVKDSSDNFTIDSSYDLAFQPTVTADKVTNPLINIDKNARLQTPSGEYKRVIDMTTQEILDIHFKTMGNMYTRMKQNITSDYNLFFRQVSHTPLLEVQLRNAGIDPNGTYTYEQFRDIIFPIINNFANSDNTAGTLFESRSAVEVFNDIVSLDSNVVVNIHNVGKKNLETNPVLDYHYQIYTNQALFQQQVYKNQGRFIKDCIQNFKIYWKNENGDVDEEIQGAVARLKQLGIVSSEQNFIDNWVEPETQQIILAKINGEPIFRRDADQIIPGVLGLEINPLFEAFYAHDQMFSVQFVTSTVGGCYGHKNNFKTTNLTPGTIEYMEEEEAGRLLTQYKRMVIYPATTHVYNQELLEGCATQIKVALVSDVAAPVYNFLDEQDDIDAHDGSGACTPWVSDWENGSLGDAAAGTDKKTIGHNMNHQYLMGTEFKWALFAITNEKVVNSGKNNKGISYRQVLENMTDIEWDTAGREFDITKTYFGNDISLLDFGKRIIFKAAEQYNKEVRDDFGAIDYLWETHPELAQIGTKQDFIDFINTIYPNSSVKDIYWHGTDSDFSNGLASATRGQGSGAPETGTEMYFNRQPWASLQYITGVNRDLPDEDGFNNWVKLWWELKEILGNGRMENDDWRQEIIGPNVRQNIPNKRGKFSRVQPFVREGNGTFLIERKARYGYQNRSDEDFFREVFGINYGVDTFESWVNRNKERFKEIWKNREFSGGLYPVLINSENPITESGQDTYYEEHRGLFTQAKANNNDAILSSQARNELGSDVSVVFNPQDNVTFLGSQQNIEDFRQFVAHNKRSNTVIPGRHYEVKGLIHTGHNLYTVQLLEVNDQGQQVGDIFNVENIEINSNFKLWNVFGAEFSEEIQEDPIKHTTKLIPSNSSSKLVTFFGNNTGYLRASDDPDGIIHPELAHQEGELERYGNKIRGISFYRTTAELQRKENLTQRDVYQPMKYSDISYIVNPSAVKNGQINVNPREAWYKKTKLRHFTVSMKHFGVQMDADHHADDAELTEMSQVISALESNGYTHHIAREAYRDLGAIVEVQLKPYLDAIANYYQLGDRKSLYEVVGKAFLNSFNNTSQDRADLADRLVYNLKKQLGDKLSLTEAQVYIPFSDNTVLSKAIAAITSQINKTAIKRRYSGIAAVMIPAYDFIKIYKTENGTDSTFRGLVNSLGTPDRVNTQLEKQTQDGPVLTSRQIRLGRTYRNLNTGEVITLDTLPKYYAAREAVNVQYQEDFTVGRNLQPARTSFKSIDNTDEIFDIYDTTAVKNRIAFSQWFNDYEFEEIDKTGKKQKIKRQGFKKASNKVTWLTTIRKSGPNKYSTPLEDLQEIISKVNYDKDKNNNSRTQELYQKILRTNNPDYITVYVKQIGEYLKQEVVETFRHLYDDNEVYIDGIGLIEVDPDSIVQEEAELVLSKIYATKYGLTTGVNLNDINEEWFEKQIEGYLKPTNVLYNIALKRANGVHTYIVLKNNAHTLIEQGLQKVEVKPERDYITGKSWRKDSVTGKKLMPFDDCELYVGADGTEYVVTDNIEQFINHKEYESIQINNRNGVDPNPAFLALNTLAQHNDSRLLQPFKNVKDAQEFVNTQAIRETKAIKRAAKRKWTSFQKSLEFTAARIPSQSMQSYMPMKVVGFTDSEENKAYVSHFQAFLQGSDYQLFVVEFHFPTTIVVKILQSLNLVN